MKLKNIFFISLIAMPLTFLEVSAAGNTDRLKDTIIDKTIQKFEDGFNSFFTNTELTIEGRTAADPNFTLLTINPVSKMKQKEIWLFFKDQLLDKIIGIQSTLELVIDNLAVMKSGFMV